MGWSARFLLLADAISSVETFVNVFIGLYWLVIFVYILASWLRLPYSPTLNRIQRFLYDVCEPYLRLFRRILPPLGPLDLSPIIGVFTLGILDRVVQAMQEAAGAARFEVAARWREKFEQLEWLLAATCRARSARDLLTFVYRDPGEFGDDRVYLVRQGVVLAWFPYPSTPIELEAFRAVVAEEAARPSPPAGPLPLESIDEILLLMSWFRAHPEALRRTSAYAEWAA